MSEYDVIPETTMGALERYVQDHISTGGFLYSVLTNDLMGAMAKADYANQLALSAICKFVYNRMPIDAWGSDEKIRAWLKRK